MKLICTQENFKKAIFNTERVVSKQTTLPILNNLLFKAEKGNLKVLGTNLEMGVEVKISAKIEKEGGVTIPSKLISNFVNNLPKEENIQLEVFEQSLKVKSGNSKAVIKGLSSEDFPLIPQRNTEYLLKIKAAKLKGVISRALVCTAISEARQELTGVNLILGKKDLFFASTDSFRLSENILNLEKEDMVEPGYSAFAEKNPNIIIPANTLSELARIIPSEEEGSVQIAIEDGQIFFSLDGTILVSRLINGKYPEYKHIMPKNYATQIVLDKNSFQSAVKMASLFSSNKTNEIIVKIDQGASKIFIEAKSAEAGENVSELNFSVQGPSQEVVLNSRYLNDGINTINTSFLALLVNSNSSPVALREINSDKEGVKEDYTYIVMPIKN